MRNKKTLLILLCIFFLIGSFLVGLSSGGTDLITEKLLKENDFILTQNSQNITAWEYRSLIFYNAGNFSEAIGVAQKTLTLDPKSKFSWHIIGTSWGNLGYYDRANEAFDKSLKLDASDPGLWNGKGVALSKLKRYNEAITSFTTALSIDPQCAVIWNNLGVTQYNNRQIDDALTSFEKAIQLDPQEPIFQSNKGQTYLAKGDINQAENTVRSITTRNPDSVAAWFVIADTSFLKEKYDNAYYGYEHGFSLLEKDKTWFNSDDSDIKITKDMDAISSYYKSIASNINFTESWDKTIIVDYKLRRYSGTLASYDQLMIIEPDYETAKEQQAVSALYTERYETARSFFQDILVDKPQESQFIAGEALAMANLGDYLGSLEKTDEALRYDPDSAYVWEIKGDIYSLYAQFDDAIQSYDKSLTLQRNNGVQLSLSDVQFRKGDYLGSIINYLHGTLGI